MLDLLRLPRWLRNGLTGIYFVYFWGISIFILYQVFRSIKNREEIGINAAATVLVAMAVVIPLIPFAKQLSLPGVSFALADKVEKVEAVVSSGSPQVETALRRIAELDLSPTIQAQEGR